MQTRPVAVCSAASQNFFGVGGGARNPARPRPALPVRAPGRGRSFPGKFHSKIPPLWPHFPRRFPAVAGVAQALEVPRIGEQPPVPPVVPDVVHVGGPRPDASPVAFPAEGLPKELPGPEVVRPDFQRVPAPPSGGILGPGRGLRLVARAISLPGQGPAAGMPAGPQRFQCHRAITSVGKIKTPEPTNIRWGCHGLWRLTLWPLAISRMISVRHVRQ